jgi:hypothetical protein
MTGSLGNSTSGIVARRVPREGVSLMTVAVVLFVSTMLAVLVADQKAEGIIFGRCLLGAGGAAFLAHGYFTDNLGHSLGDFGYALLGVIGIVVALNPAAIPEFLYRCGDFSVTLFGKYVLGV